MTIYVSKESFFDVVGLGLVFCVTGLARGHGGAERERERERARSEKREARKKTRRERNNAWFPGNIYRYIKVYVYTYSICIT